LAKRQLGHLARRKVNEDELPPLEVGLKKIIPKEER
jgi:hypothetical protein